MMPVYTNFAPLKALAMGWARQFKYYPRVVHDASRLGCMASSVNLSLKMTRMLTVLFPVTSFSDVVHFVIVIEVNSVLVSIKLVCICIIQQINVQ